MATTYDKASLVMIPSGVKESKLYSIKPTDGSGDFTFSRGTDTATRVNASGLIEKERSNQLLQSNTFSTTWANFNTTETSGQSGYDGSNDAWLLQNTAANGSIRQTISFSGVQTYSFYAKAGTTDWVAAYVATSGSIPYCFFDLTNGVKGATQNNVIDSSITDVGGGWYRIALAFDIITTDVRIFPAEANAVLASQVGDNIYIQDAQLEQGLVATDYIETTTAAVYEGITDNLPRLDYSGGASCPSLLLEPSRTNIIDQSEYIASWLDVNTTQESNYATSPEGVQNATRIVMTSATGEHSVYDSVSVTSGTQYTQSIFLKQGDGSANWRYFQFRFRSGGFGGLYGVVVDLQEGTIGYDTGLDDYGIEDYGNGWYRVWITATATTTSSNAGPVVAFNELADAYDVSIVGDTNADVLVYGAQWEAGSYPTSYIPTYGTSASRAKDDVVKSSVSSLIGQTEGTLFAEFEYFGNTTGALEISPLYIGTGTYQTAIYLDIYQGNIYGVVFNGGVSQASINCGTLSIGKHKAALAYSANDIVVYVDGSLGGSDTSATIPACNQIHLGEVGSSTSIQKYSQQQALVFKTRLTNAELAALTTL